MVGKYNQSFGDGKQAFFAKERNPDFFVVKHFAGDVSYKITNFMEKNKDALAELLTEALEGSSQPLVKEVFLYDKDHANDNASPTKRRGGGALNKPTIAKLGP